MGTKSLGNGVLIGIVLLGDLVYAVTFSRSSSLDSLAYFRGVEMGSAEDWVHPHHLVYLPLQKAWCALWSGLGYSGRFVLPPSPGLSLTARRGWCTMESKQGGLRPAIRLHRPRHEIPGTFKRLMGRCGERSGESTVLPER